MMSLDDRKVIERALRNGNVIQFEYYPNKVIPGVFRGIRRVIPLSLVNKGGKSYLFGIFYSGVSASGKIGGYRLYFTNNMYDVKRLNAAGKVVKQSKNFDREILKIILEDLVE